MILSLSQRALHFPFGEYQHYKGGKYKVLNIVFHHETLEEWVVYQAEYGEKQYFIRPLEMFLEEVEVLGVSQPRFRYIGTGK